MNCTNMVAVESYGKKGKTRPLSSRPEWIKDVKSPAPYDSETWTNHHKKLVPDADGVFWKRCTGKLKMMIEAVDEPEYGGHYADLTVHYECSMCGPCLVSPSGMADKYNLNEWVNALMDRVDSMDFKDTATIEREMNEVKNALMNKILTEEPEMFKNQKPDQAQRNALAMAMRRIMEFNHKRLTQSDPNWNRLNLETAKAVGLL